MPVDRKERSFPFLLISLIAHLALFTAIPLVGYPQIGKPYGTGGPLEVTMLASATASSSSASPSQNVVVSSPKTPVAQTPKPTTPTVKPATSRVLTTTSPAATKQPAATTSSVAVTPRVSEPKTTQSNNQASTGTSTGSSSGSSSNTSAAVEIPYGGDVISIIQNPSFFKEAVSLNATATVRMAVTVSAGGSWKSAVIVQSNGTTAVNDYARRATEKFLKYASNSKDYEVTVSLIVNPENRTTHWSIPDDRVRIVD